MIKLASGYLAQTAPITVIIGDILYHPEAIMLAVKPAHALTAVHDTVQAAAQARDPQPRHPRRFPALDPPRNPLLQHANQAAEPIIAALKPQLPKYEIQVSAISLVLQHGPERLWDWHTVDTIRLHSPAQP